MKPESAKHTNKLAAEKNPYLLQHANNPVDWYPWGEEAFEKARRENKPIFLSIGYSTCHWCHVMEHESFEDPEAAKLMNEAFVSIKVDREERPDIDGVYMHICQMMTGSGGWPLTIFMTPDKKPFFAGTYFPKESRFGRAGLMELIPKVQEAWKNRHEEILNSADSIAEELQRSPDPSQAVSLDESILRTAYTQLSRSFDPQQGGFGRAPKFPTPHHFLFLLRYWHRTEDPEALSMVEKTLQAMRRGGMYDQIGFGFHRYSTDASWFLPHFEKMLYDQALLANAYIETYQATRNPFYKNTAREILTYVLRDMTSPEGGFYSAEDADSEGEEGKFYVWTAQEISALLSSNETDFSGKIFNLEANGNFRDEASGGRTGANILYLKKPIDQTAQELGVPGPEFEKRMESVRQKLFQAREKRIHPHKDDKILTDWNGLMIAALARAAQVLGEPEYARAAIKAVDFIFQKMSASPNQLYHRYREGEAAVSGFLDDYAFLIWGLLELYETTFETRFLEKALALNEILLQNFWDEEERGFFFTAKDAENVLVRRKDAYDGAVPSGNSIALWNLLRLARITGNAFFEEKAEKTGQAFSKSITQLPSAFTQMMVGVDFGVGPSYEIVIVGQPESSDTQAMLKALREKFIPNKVILLRPAGKDSVSLAQLAEFTKEMNPLEGKATAYICLKGACQFPTTDPKKMLEHLKKNSL
jgi:uncharacterized protein YyaL (SSP411 family)